MLAIALSRASEIPTKSTVITCVVVSLSAVALAMYRLFGEFALGFASLLAVLPLIWPDHVDPVYAVPFVLFAMYLVSAYSPRSHHHPWLAWFLVYFAISPIISLTRLASDQNFGRDFLQVAGMLLIIWAALGFFWQLGLGKRRRKEHLEILQQRAELAAVIERNRIAREMHDIVAHTLSGITALADGGRYFAKDNPEVAIETLQTISLESRKAVGDMRGLLSVLRDGDSREAISTPGTAELQTLISEARQKGVDLTVEGLSEVPDDLPALAQFTVYRVCQELITNILRYSADGKGELKFEVDSKWLSISSRNRSSNNEDTGGLGLTGMQERVHAHNGILHVNRGEFFEVKAAIPR